MSGDKHCKVCEKIDNKDKNQSHSKCLHCSKCWEYKLYRPSICNDCSTLWTIGCSSDASEEGVSAMEKARSMIVAWIKRIVKNRSMSKNLGEGMTADHIWYDSREKETYQPFWNNSLAESLKVGQKVVSKSNRSRSCTPTNLSDSQENILTRAMNSSDIPVFDLEARDNNLKEEIMRSLDEKMQLMGASIIEKISENFKKSGAGPSNTQVRNGWLCIF